MHTPVGTVETTAMPHALRQFKADIFQALAHPTRIAIVELLRHGEVPAGTIFVQLDVEQANASQHLAVLRAKHIVVNRKVGNQVFYTLRSRRLVEVLDAMRLYFQEHLSEAMEMLEEINQEDAAAAVSSGKRQ